MKTRIAMIAAGMLYAAAATAASNPGATQATPNQPIKDLSSCSDAGARPARVQAWLSSGNFERARASSTGPCVTAPSPAEVDYSNNCTDTEAQHNERVLNQLGSGNFERGITATTATSCAAPRTVAEIDYTSCTLSRKQAAKQTTNMLLNVPVSERGRYLAAADPCSSEHQ